jgi:hypothetical protein
MRLVLKISAGLVFLVVAGVVALFTVPQISEKNIEWTCSLSTPSENCVTRMRAMGHTWSMWGKLSKARVSYTRAAEHGDVTAMFHLAWAYERDGYRERDAAYEARRQKRAAGVRYEDLGPEPNIASFARAVEWYRKAAAKGFAPAMNNLGELYQGGNGVPRDPREGFRLILAAAQAGNPIASWNVVGAHWTNAGVEFDQAEVTKWSTWKPKGMTPDLADLTLQRTNMNGEGLPARYREALRVAAEKGEPVTLTSKPLRPDPSVPTFKQVAR